MTNEFQVGRALDAVAASDVRWLLLSGEEDVQWLAGVETPIETGPSPFRGGAPLVLLNVGAPLPVVVTANSDAPSAATQNLVTYRGVSSGDPEPILENYLKALRAAMDTAEVSGLVGVDLRTLPASVDRFLRAQRIPLVDVGSAIDRARSVKSDTEVTLLRNSARVASIAQRAALERATVGQSELDLFAALRRESEVAVGARLPFAGDLLSGIDRTANVGGWPGARAIQADDPIITDLAPRVAGYWADSCNSFALGGASSEYRKMHERVHAALASAVKIAGPGVPANVIDRTLRRSLAEHDLSYPHHSGHGIGTSVHEWPRIIPGETAPLEVGMVVLLEPGAYRPTVGGVRLEHMFLVTASGLEQFTDFPMVPGADRWPSD